MVYYWEYINSPLWKQKASDFRRHFGYLCQSHLARGELARGWQIHHKHYKTLGHETVQDVTLLCEDCHRAAHGLPPLNPPVIKKKSMVIRG